jgi:NitT/TauT family transport system permease protein
MSVAIDTPITREPTRRASGRGRSWRILARALVLPILAGAAWQSVVYLKLLPPLLFPSLWTIATSTLDTFTGYSGTADWYSGKWLVEAAATTQRVLAGFAIGGMLGVMLGVIAGMFSRLHEMVDPSVQVLRPIPIVAWIPLAVAWFGIGNPPAIFLIALGTFFPTYINARLGVRYVDPVLIRATQMLGHTHPWQIFRQVIFWGALPSIFTGLRIGLGLAWICVATAEMLAVKSGFGYMLWDSYNFLRIDLIITAMISIAVLGYLADRLLLFVQSIVMNWEER